MLYYQQVNGERILLQSGEHKHIKLSNKVIFATIYNREGRYLIEVPSMLAFYVNHGNIEISASPTYNGMGAGICGDYNRNRMFELQGPKHCLYDDQHQKLFYKSFISEKIGCPYFDAWENEVKQFQANCTKA